MGKTKIEWADHVWNPVTGCSKVSEGCRNCYAKAFTERFKGTPGHYFENGFDVTFRPDKLDQPLRWSRSRRIFVNSMSDLFHPEVPDNFIDQVFAVMALAPQHTFQILTKRPERMRDWVRKHGNVIGTKQPALQNVWLGVSVENQKAADERIPLLIQTPAVVRFLSCEPLLGPLDLRKIHSGPNEETIDWIIVGGESGPGARPMHPDWARSLRDQCQAAGVAFFFKQWGEWLPFQHAGNGQCVAQTDLTEEQWCRESIWLDEVEGIGAIKVGKKAAGRLLDGCEWNEFPELRT